MATLFFLVAYVVSVPIIAIIAFRWARQAKEETRILRQRLDALSGAAAPAEPVPAPPVTEAEKAEAPPAAARETVSETPRPPSVASAAVREVTRAKAGVEEQLTSRWMVWLGGVTLALAAIFLVKYSIEQDIIGPGLRVALGLLLAVALVAGGEYLRQRPISRAIAAMRPDYVPAALSAAGLFAAFAAIYAGYALYGLYGALPAFVLLAGVSVAGIALALLQGPFIAALGLVGGYAVPALVVTGSENALALFLYTLAVTLGGLGIVRYRAWTWLWWLSIAGSILWVFVWFIYAWEASDTWVLGGYLLALTAAFTWSRWWSDLSPVGETGWRSAVGFATLPMPERAAGFAYLAVTVAFFGVVRMDNYGDTSVALFAAFAVLAFVVARREQVFAGFPWAVGVAGILMVGLWQVPRVIDWGASDALPWMSPIIPPELLPMVTVAAIWGAIFALGGFVALWGAAHPGLWASLSAAVPLGILAALHGQLNGFSIDFNWAFVALGAAIVSLAAAERIRRYRTAAGMDGALGAYAVGVVAALSLAAAMAVEEAWLTVALALQLPGIAWVDRHLDLQALRRTALAVAGVVIVRLLANVEIFSYGFDSPVPGVNWILYGYGLPALAFYLARRLFAGRDRTLAMVLEAGTLALAVALVSLEIRHLMAPDGRLDLPYDNLMEQSLLSLTWLAAGYGLMMRHKGETPVLDYGWRILLGAAAAQVAILQVLAFNPLWHHGNVGEIPLFNGLLLAYAAPAVFAVLIGWQAARRGWRRLSMAASGSGLFLAFLWISLEIRQFFHGGVLATGGTTDAEWYSYSAAWLLYGMGLLGLGTWLQRAALRHASLAVVLLTVGKVFVSDMSALTGLYRVLSFLGLGLVLVAIGFFYQRFVLPKPATPS